MVGVPGRSKCCGTCRKRKKGNCDRKRPSCTQCLRAGLKCDGYARETIFLNATSGRAKQYRLDPAPEPVVVVAPRSAPARDLARAAHEERYLGNFWSVYLPESREFPSSATPYMSGGWTVALPKLYGTSPVIRRIILAVSLSLGGQTPGRERDREEGLRYYTSSLEKVAGALRDGKKIDHTTLVITARLFSLYEIHFGHDSRDVLAQAGNWCKHITGELALIMSQPPQTYASGYMHQLFADGRLHLTSVFIQTRKRSPLSDPDWRTIPWKTTPKTPKDLVIDILIEVPGLLEDLDILNAQHDPATRELLRQDLIQKCWDIESDLVAWRETVKISEPDYSLDVLSAPFSMDLFVAAHILCTYWSACIITYGTLRDVLSVPEAACLPAHMDPRIYFRRVAEAVTVLLHPSSGLYGVQLTHLPTLLVLVYMDAWGGMQEVREMLLNAYGRSGRDKIVERFHASMRRQEVVSGW